MQVISKPGTRCPKEGKPRDYIGDIVTLAVPESSYYLRLVADGSLIRVDAPDAASAQSSQMNTNTPSAEGSQAHKGGKKR